MKHIKLFEEFISEFELVNEALKSNILRSLLKKTRWSPGVDRDFFNTLSNMGIAASNITDDQIKELTPVEATFAIKKDVNPNAIYIFYSTTKKNNPYAKEESTIPKDIFLAMVKDKKYIGLEIDRSKTRSEGKRVYKFEPEPNSFGWVHTGRGYGSTGLNTVRKMADMSDVVYVIDPSTLPSSTEIKKNRKESKQGATALISPDQFKKTNLARYEEILAERANKPEKIDRDVKRVIFEAADMLKQGIEDKKIGQFGDFVIGLDPKGNEIEFKHLNNFTSNLIDKYQKYVEYSNKVNSEESDFGKDYYRGELKNIAKSIDSMIKSFDKKNIIRY